MTKPAVGQVWRSKASGLTVRILAITHNQRVHWERVYASTGPHRGSALIRDWTYRYQLTKENINGK